MKKNTSFVDFLAQQFSAIDSESKTKLFFKSDVRSRR